MQPNGPQPTPPPLHPNAYSFITDHNKAGKRGLLPTGGSKQSRILLVVGIVLTISIIGVVIMAVLNGIDNGQKQDWLSLAQKQQELIRISDVGATKAQGRDTKNLATTTKLSLESSQASINSLAKKSGANVNSKALLLGKDSKTDADLKIAEQTNQFDTTFHTILKNELNEYQAPLTISLKCDPELAVILREKYETVLEGYHLNKKHWNTIILSGQLPLEEVQGFIRHSYDLVTGIPGSSMPKTE